MFRQWAHFVRAVICALALVSAHGAEATQEGCSLTPELDDLVALVYPTFAGQDARPDPRIRRIARNLDLGALQRALDQRDARYLSPHLLTLRSALSSEIDLREWRDNARFREAYLNVLSFLISPCDAERATSREISEAAASRGGTDYRSMVQQGRPGAEAETRREILEGYVVFTYVAAALVILYGLGLLLHYVFGRIYAYIYNRKSCDIPAIFVYSSDRLNLTVRGKVTVIGRKGCRFEPRTESDAGLLEGCSGVAKLTVYFDDIALPAFLYYAQSEKVGAYFDRPILLETLDHILQKSLIRPRESRGRPAAGNLPHSWPKRPRSVREVEFSEYSDLLARAG